MISKLYIPKTLKVGGHKYTILIEFIHDSNLAGICNHQTHVIKITPFTHTGEERARSNIEATFIHELLHIVNETYNAGKLNESTITRLSEGLYQALVDNGIWLPEEKILKLEGMKSLGDISLSGVFEDPIPDKSNKVGFK